MVLFLPSRRLHPKGVGSRASLALATFLSVLPVGGPMVEVALAKPASTSSEGCRADTLTAVNAESLGGQAQTESLQLPRSTPYLSLLRRSWVAYRDRFIHPEGYVIDRFSEDQRTTSEGQAYAMLRAVLINDRASFDLTLNWAEKNLARPSDSLWAWKWTDGSIEDINFATDGDIDAITALIFAARRWDCPAYEVLAQKKLADVWRVAIAQANGSYYLLPGPAEAFWQTPEEMILNPSYFAPYAYRLFAQVDPSRNWSALITDSYDALDKIAALSETHLPPDWITLDTTTGRYRPVLQSPGRTHLKTIYSFDAYRVWWRVGLDAAWFRAPRARAYLRQNMDYITQRWKTEPRIFAVMELSGEPLVDYEATAHYAALYPALKHVDSQIAFEIFTQKLLPQYQRGFWESDSAYYAQNLAWFSLLPPLPLDGLLTPGE